MLRVNLKLVILIGVALMASVAFLVYAQTPPTPVVIENDRLRLTFLKTANTIALQSVFKKDSGYNFDVDGIKWKIRLIDLTQAPTTYPEVTKNEAELNCQTSHSLATIGGLQNLNLNWDNCTMSAGNTFDVNLSVNLANGQDFADWKVSINNDMTDYSVRYIKLFWGILANSLGDNMLTDSNWVEDPASTLALDGTAGYLDEGHTSRGIRMGLAYWTDNQQGLYLIPKDSTPNYFRTHSYSSDGNRFIYGLLLYPDAIGQAGNNFSMNYDMSFGIFTGDWYDAAKIYRNWAIAQPWAATKLENRTDIPIWWRELEIGEARAGNPTLNTTLEVQKLGGIKNFYNLDYMVSFYWPGTAAGDPYFVPYPWLGTVSNNLSSLGIKTLIFTNPHPLAASHPDYTALTPLLCKDMAGQPYVDSGSSSFNSTYPVRQNMYANDVKNNLVQGVGLSGIFVEIPIPKYPDMCFNSPLPGQVGGIYPFKGMRDLLNAVRQTARTVNPNFITMYEFFHDAYFEVTDTAFDFSSHMPPACFSLFTCSNKIRGVPLLSTIYHDRITTLGWGTWLQGVQTWGLSDLTYFNLLDRQVALDFAWGLRFNTAEPYINSLNLANHEVGAITDPAFQPYVQAVLTHVNFLKDLIAARKSSEVKKYLVYGEMLRPLPTNIQEITVNYQSVNTPNPSFTVSRKIADIGHSVWKATNGKIGLVFTNPKSTSANINFTFNASAYGLSTTQSLGLYLLQGITSAQEQTFTGSLTHTFSLPAKSVRFYEVYAATIPPSPSPSPTPTPSPSPSPGIPAAPSNLSTSAAGPNQINLVWTDNANNETGFKVERSLNASSGFTEIANNLPINTTTFTDTTGLEPNTTYFYRVRAFNTLGNSNYSNIAAATTPIGLTIPNPPLNFTAQAISPNQIRLNWTDASTNEIGFKIEKSVDGIVFAPLEEAPANFFLRVISGLAPDTTYYFRIRSYNSAGISAYVSVSARTPGVSTAPIFTINLYRGLRHAQVGLLQLCLKTNPAYYPEGIVSNFFGFLTEQAVKRFQGAQGIVSSGSPATTGYGFVGPRTRTALNTYCAGLAQPGVAFNKDLFFGMIDPEVTTLQQFLARNPVIYPQALVTGYFGTLTRAALVNFQVKYGLLQTGRVDAGTPAKLNELYTANLNP